MRYVCIFNVTSSGGDCPLAHSFRTIITAAWALEPGGAVPSSLRDPSLSKHFLGCREE